MGDRLLACSLVLMSCFYVVNVVFSSIAGATEGVIFTHQTGKVSHNHTIQMTPDNWTFMIWSLIYLWIAFGFAYLLVNIFRSNKDGYGKVYSNPTVFTKEACWIMILNLIFHFVWLFVWDSLNMTAASVILFCIAGTNWTVLVIFSRKLWEKTEYLKIHAPCDLFCYRLLVQNSLATYTIWTTIAALLNFGIALVYDAKLDDPTPSIVVIVILTILLSLWVPLETIFWDNYFRYMLTPLFVVTWALTGVCSRLEKVAYEDQTITVYSSVLLGCVAVMLLTRITLTVYRQIKRPLV